MSMKIISPELMWIDGRCYRINPERIIETVGPDVLEMNDSYEIEDKNSDDEEPDYIIEERDDIFRSSFHVPQYYYGLIIGARGVMRKRIESDTKAKIFIPRQGQKGDVIVTGPYKKNVVKARRRIDLIVIAARSKQPFTHFLSIPFNSQPIQEAFKEFRSIILHELKTIDPRLFQQPQKLHLTIGTICLIDNEDRVLAAHLLKECQEKIIKPTVKKYGPFKLKMSGLEIMNDDPTAVDVLYGCIQEETTWENDGVLQNMLNEIVDFFAAKGLMQKQYERVKLHVTLMNSLFCPDSENESRKNFDASLILKAFDRYEFGTQVVQEIHLSQRYSTGCDGYYQSTMNITC